MNIIKGIEDAIAEAIEEHYPGQGISYAVSVNVLSTGDGQGGYQPVLVTAVTAPGLVLNEVVVATVISQNLAPSTEEIQSSVVQAVEQMLRTRSEEARKVLLAQP